MCLEAYLAFVPFFFLDDMKIRILFAGMALAVCAGVCGQANPVLLRIQGRDILKSDFDRYLTSQAGADKDFDKEACFEEFVFESLKVTDALEAGWDKKPVFLQRLKTDVGHRVKARFVDALCTDSLFAQLHASGSGRFASDEWVKIRCISIPLRQNAGKAAERQALSRLDSVYRAIQGGARFDAFASDDSRWSAKRELPQEFQENLSGLAENQFSKPFLSPEGAYIVQLEARRDVSERDIASLAEVYADNRLLLQDKVSAEKLRAWSVADVERTDWYKTLARDVRDSLLVSLWNRKNGIESDCEVDSTLLERFFGANKRKFSWTLPHFKGAVIRCASKKEASRIKKYLKRVPVAEWTEAIAVWNRSHADAPARIDCGLFRIGQNPYVDKLEFKCGEFPDDADYAFTLGKRLGTTPDCYLDVYAKVKKEYLLSERKSLIDSLKSRYAVEVVSGY